MPVKQQNNTGLPETAKDREGTPLHYGDIVYIIENDPKLPKEDQNIVEIYRKNAHNPFSYSTKDKHAKTKTKQIDVPEGIPNSIKHRPFVYIGDIDGYPYYAPITHICYDNPDKKTGTMIQKHKDFMRARIIQAGTNTKSQGIQYWYGSRIPLTKAEPMTREFLKTAVKHPEKYWHSDLVLGWALPLQDFRVQKIEPGNPDDIKKCYPEEKAASHQRLAHANRLTIPADIIQNRKQQIQSSLVSFITQAKQQQKILPVLLKQYYDNNLDNFIPKEDRKGLRTYYEEDDGHGGHIRRILPNLQKFAPAIYGANYQELQNQYIIDGFKHQKYLDQIKTVRNTDIPSKKKGRTHEQ